MKATPESASSRERRAWRRKWKRVPAERRRQAAAALTDFFVARRRTEPLLAILLAVSLIFHVAAIAVLPAADAKTLAGEIERGEQSYLKKVIQKERAELASADSSRGTMTAPPPPNPEQFVSETLTDELSRTLSPVTAGILDVKLEKSLTDHVQATLADELQEASRKIATGKLSEDQIKQIQRDFKQKAVGAAKEWREVHREEYQVDIAAKSVTQWYEDRVASQIRNMVMSALFTGRGPIWDQCFGNRELPPGFIPEHTRQPFVSAHDQLVALGNGQFWRDHFGKSNRPDGLAECKDAGRGLLQLPGWPDKPSKVQAELFARLLSDLGRGWDRAFDRYVLACYPHRAAELDAKKKQLAELWTRLAGQSEAFQMKAAQDPATAAPDLKTCIATLKEVNAAWATVFADTRHAASYRTINQAVRSRVLRSDFRETAYRQMIDLLVTKLRPPIEQLAEGQFREGIVLSEQGVHEAMKEFRTKAIVLLRRDMENTVTRPFFQRKLFTSSQNPYYNEITKENGAPDEKQITADEAALDKAIKALPEPERAFADARAAAVKKEILQAIADSIDQMLDRIVTPEGRLKREYYERAETVDYADPLKEKLEARDMALKGRRQDLTDLSEEGVPDVSTPLVALASGVGSSGGAPKPVVATMHPGYFGAEQPASVALRGSTPKAPPQPAEWGFVTQAKATPPFNSDCIEAIPFLVNFPNLDGDLGDWGKVRPLILTHDNVRDEAFKTEPILVYAAWNYQGFFFGYNVKQEPIKFSLPSQYRIDEDGVTLIKDPNVSAYNSFVERSDFFVVMLDTLDARLPFRGDPHAQEFYILPKGSATDPDLPGAERVFASRRYGMQDGNFGWARRICQGKLFPPQPRSGPDGTGPYRVTRQTETGYTVEVFLPRTVFRVPVFAPGWYVGFECFVGVGKQPTGSGAQYVGKGWANRTSWPSGTGNSPNRWGDLLLLGTDARMTIQDAAAGWPNSTAVLPGRSYLVTVVDPDRNVNLAAIDTVLVSAEVIPPGGGKGSATDVELFVLKETGNNTSVFQGCIDTQPGSASKVHGIVEASPGSEVRFGYVDIGDSKGRRNVIHEWKLPVAAPTILITGAR